MIGDLDAWGILSELPSFNSRRWLASRQIGKTFGCSLKIDLSVVASELSGVATSWATVS